MADISYTKKDNLCYNTSLGNIVVNQITFTTPQEQQSFSSYVINWSGDFYSSSQISNDGKIVEFLSNGTYSFTVASLIDSSVLGPYTIEITSPSELKITNIKYSKYSCNNNGSMSVYISGGVPPYTVYGFGGSVTSYDSVITVDSLKANSYSISVSDANNCKIAWDNRINIQSSSISFTVDQILAPVLLDSYGIVKFKISGIGPFTLKFEKEDSDEIIFIDFLDTKYITDIDSINNIYSYKIDDKFTPGTYSVNITNNNNCSYSDSISVSNIAPMSVNCSIVNNNDNFTYDARLSLPIFDCLFIPYKHIQENTKLWQLVHKLKLKDLISIKINENIRQYKIVRNMLNKYCLDENKIEILRLGNNPNDWFYYFYIAPSVNLSVDPSLTSASYAIVDTSDGSEYPMNLGINEYNAIDSDKPSLLKGSFLLQGTDHAQFGSNTGGISTGYSHQNNANVNIGIDELENSDFFIENISKLVLKNIYVADYVTSINFLDNFHRLISEIDINDSACNMSMDDYQYSLNIKNLLKTINNFNNINNTYIYNSNYKANVGQVLVFIFGNPIFLLENAVSVTNEYDITYYTFDEDSDKPSTFYENNQLVKSFSLKNLKEGYVIIRIKDLYDNIPRTILYNNSQFDYDTHFSKSKNIIQKYNKNITSFFQYGDILVYVGSNSVPNPPIDDITMPKSEVTEPAIFEETNTIDTVYQTPDSTNTSSLSVTLYKNIKCLLVGPKNYKYEFNKNTEFKNLIPGVYTITGNIYDLYNNNLYQQEYRILIDRNTTNILDVDFASYKDQTFIKEI